MPKRTIGLVCGALCAAALVIASVNYVTLQRVMSQVKQGDTRDKGIDVFVHYKYFLNPNVLVYDLRKVSDTSSPLDVTRVLLQFADLQKTRSFKTVELAHSGKDKFVLQGDFFRKLGQEYATQNPAYTLRTLPENLYKPDGSQAFGSWSGGMLGVLGKQMEDFITWHREWYINDLRAGLNQETHNAD